MNKVSLVVPVYNMEHYLERCMATLLMQTKKEYEIILVDDGSTDSSAEMCDKYAKIYADIVKVVHKQNGGLSSARNAGMKVATGSYVIFPDPDDWTEKNYVEELLKLQEEKVELVCVGYYIDYDTRQMIANEGQVGYVMSAKEAKKSLLIPPCMNGFAWNKLYNLDIIRKHELEFLDDVGTTEDLDFTFRYLEYCNNVCFAPEVRIYHYYQREGAATHSGFSRRKIDSIRTYEKIIANSQDCPELVQAAKEEICNIAINLLWVYENNSCKDIEAKQLLKKQLRNTLKYYLRSKRYGWGRKVQAMMAYVSLPLYCGIKNMLTKEKKC